MSSPAWAPFGSVAGQFLREHGPGLRNERALYRAGSLPRRCERQCGAAEPHRRGGRAGNIRARVPPWSAGEPGIAASTPAHGAPCSKTHGRASGRFGSRGRSGVAARQTPPVAGRTLGGTAARSSWHAARRLPRGAVAQRPPGPEPAPVCRHPPAPLPEGSKMRWTRLAAAALLLPAPECSGKKPEMTWDLTERQREGRTDAPRYCAVLGNPRPVTR